VLNNVELHDIYRSPGLDIVVKCRRLRLAGHVDGSELTKKKYRILIGNHLV